MTFFPLTSSWFEPFFTLSAESSARAGDASFEALLISAILTPFLPKSEKINSTVQCNFEKIPGASLALT